MAFRCGSRELRACSAAGSSETLRSEIGDPMGDGKGVARKAAVTLSGSNTTKVIVWEEENIWPEEFSRFSAE